MATFFRCCWSGLAHLFHVVVAVAVAVASLVCIDRLGATASARPPVESVSMLKCARNQQSTISPAALLYSRIERSKKVRERESWPVFRPSFLFHPLSATRSTADINARTSKENRLLFVSPTHFKRRPIKYRGKYQQWKPTWWGDGRSWRWRNAEPQ